MVMRLIVEDKGAGGDGEPKETGESASAFRKAATCEFIFIYPGIMYTVLMPRLNGDQSDSDTAKEQVNSTVGTDEEHITYIVSGTWINVGMKTVGERLHHFYFHIFLSETKAV